MGLKVTRTLWALHAVGCIAGCAAEPTPTDGSLDQASLKEVHGLDPKVARGRALSGTALAAAAMLESIHAIEFNSDELLYASRIEEREQETKFGMMVQPLLSAINREIREKYLSKSRQYLANQNRDNATITTPNSAAILDEILSDYALGSRVYQEFPPYRSLLFLIGARGWLPAQRFSSLSLNPPDNSFAELAASKLRQLSAQANTSDLADKPNCAHITMEVAMARATRLGRWLRKPTLCEVPSDGDPLVYSATIEQDPMNSGTTRNRLKTAVRHLCRLDQAQQLKTLSDKPSEEPRHLVIPEGACDHNRIDYHLYAEGNCAKSELVVERRGVLQRWLDDSSTMPKGLTHFQRLAFRDVLFIGTIEQLPSAP